MLLDCSLLHGLTLNNQERPDLVPSSQQGASSSVAPMADVTETHPMADVTETHPSDYGSSLTRNALASSESAVLLPPRMEDLLAVPLNNGRATRPLIHNLDHFLYNVDEKGPALYPPPVFGSSGMVVNGE